MWKGEKKHSRGFTFGELLVVMAVIIVLSGVVLIGKGDSQGDALNVKRVALIRQYITAFDLYRQDNNNLYPFVSLLPVCLGDEPDDQCGGGNIGIVTESAALNAAIAPYIPGLPVLPDLNFTNISASYTGLPYYDGATYQCVEGILGCLQYELRWYMDGAGADCGPGDLESWTASDNTACVYKSMRFR